MLWTRKQLINTCTPTRQFVYEKGLKTYTHSRKCWKRKKKLLYNDEKESRKKKCRTWMSEKGFVWQTTTTCFILCNALFEVYERWRRKKPAKKKRNLQSLCTHTWNTVNIRYRVSVLKLTKEKAMSCVVPAIIIRV